MRRCASRFADVRRWSTQRIDHSPIQGIKNVFTSDQKGQLIDRVTEAMVSVEGEAMRGVPWVRVHEVEEGDWAIGGTRLTAAHIHRMANGK